jgi:hypothetical protein
MFAKTENKRPRLSTVILSLLILSFVVGIQIVYSTDSYEDTIAGDWECLANIELIVRTKPLIKGTSTEHYKFIFAEDGYVEVIGKDGESTRGTYEITPDGSISMAITLPGWKTKSGESVFKLELKSLLVPGSNQIEFEYVETPSEEFITNVNEQYKMAEASARLSGKSFTESISSPLKIPTKEELTTTHTFVLKKLTVE